MKKPKYDIISIGDPVIDSFLFVKDVEIRMENGKRKAVVSWGDKLPVQKFYRSVAGNATNNAVGSSRLGLKAAYCCVVAHDSGGREIIHKMKKEKVSVEYIKIDDRHGTNYHSVLCHDGERTIFVYHEHRKWVLPKFAPSKWVYLTSMPEGFQKIYPTLCRYLDTYKVKLGFNPGTFQLRAGIKVNANILKRTDVISLNIEEAQAWVGDDTRDPQVLCERLRKLGPKAVALTDGRKGAYSCSDEGLFYIEEYPGPKIESTGAGDAFTTAYIAALVHGLPHREALRWGPIDAGSVVQKIGPIDGLVTKKQMEVTLKKLIKFQPIPITSESEKNKVLEMVKSKRD